MAIENNVITFSYDHVNARKIKQAVSEIIFENHDDAERVLEELVNFIKMRGFASVHYLHDLVGIKSTYSDMKWGWFDLTSASVKHTHDGYILDLPRPIKRI